MRVLATLPWATLEEAVAKARIPATVGQPNRESNAVEIIQIVLTWRVAWQVYNRPQLLILTCSATVDYTGEVHQWLQFFTQKKVKTSNAVDQLEASQAMLAAVSAAVLPRPLTSASSTFGEI